MGWLGLLGGLRAITCFIISLSLRPPEGEKNRLIKISKILFSRYSLSRTTSLFSMLKFTELDFVPIDSIRIVFSGVFDSVVVFDPLIESSRSDELEK